MKMKNYEKTTAVFLVIGILGILELLFFTGLEKVRISQYQRLTLMKIDKNHSLCLVEKEEKKTLYENNHFYKNKEKIKFKIVREEDYRVGEKEYDKVELEIDKGKQQEDIMEVSIRKKKINGLEMLINIWGGD